MNIYNDHFLSRAIMSNNNDGFKFEFTSHLAL